MLKDPTEFRKRFAMYKKGKLPYKNGIPYDDDNHNIEYDHARAAQLGYTPDKTGHYFTRDYETGRYLKSPVHPTIMKSIVGDISKGYNPYYNKQDGQIYSDTWMKPLKDEVDTPYLPKFKVGKSPWDDSANFTVPYEGWSDTVYQNKGDVPTIGYGTTSKKWISKGRITREQGMQAMIEDLQANEPLLRKNIKNYDKLPDSAKIVLRDILYNVGQGNLFQKSPKFMAAINSGNYEEAANQMDWDNNKPGMGGAIKRNNARRELFLRDLRNNPIKPVSKLVQSLEESPSFQPIQIKVPVDRTDFSLQNASIKSKVPRKINAWVGAQSPAYGGYSSRIPTVEEYLRARSVMPVIYK